MEAAHVASYVPPAARQATIMVEVMDPTGSVFATFEYSTGQETSTVLPKSSDIPTSTLCTVNMVGHHEEQSQSSSNTSLLLKKMLSLTIKIYTRQAHKTKCGCFTVTI